MESVGYKQTQCLFKKRVPFEIDENGKYKLLWGKPIDNWEQERYIELPCGKCIYCQKKYSKDWAVRCVLESTKSKDNCFITLTYNEENVPKDYNLSKRDYQLFLKRLRKKVHPLKVRYFLAGEYGGKRYRPHFHIIIFGWKPNDLEFWKIDGKVPLYISEEVSKLWGKGFISVGVQMDIAAMKYTAKYLNKLQVLPNYVHVKPFVAMSTRPGIGAGVIDSERWLKNQGIFIDGFKHGVPRYFKKLAIKEGKENEVDSMNRKIKVRAQVTKLTKEERDKELYLYFWDLERKGIDYKHLLETGRWDFWDIYKNVQKDIAKLKEVDNIRLKEVK